MARRIIQRPMLRVARRLQLRALMRGVPAAAGLARQLGLLTLMPGEREPAAAARIIRQRPRLITARSRIVRRHPSRSATLPPRPAIQQLQPQQQQLQQQQSSLTDSHDHQVDPAGDYEVAIQFVNLVKTTLNSEDKFRAFIQLLDDYKTKLARGDESADLADTVSRVVELLQDHPQLIAGFRVFVPQRLAELVPQPLAELTD